MVVGSGTIIAAIVDGAPARPVDVPAFIDAHVTALDGQLAERVQEVLHAGTPMLDIGSTASTMAARPTAPRARIATTGFARHTFLCGQSGSGKTFSMGVLLEQLLLGSDIRIVVLDPNSDHVGLGRLLDRSRADGMRACPRTDAEWQLVAERHAAVREHVHVLQSPAEDRDTLPLRVRLADVGIAAMAAMLGIDPLVDDDLWDALEDGLSKGYDGARIGPPRAARPVRCWPQGRATTAHLRRRGLAAVVVAHDQRRRHHR